MTTDQTKTTSHLPPPPTPEGKPFHVGETKAIVNTHKTGGKETITLRLSRLIKAKPEKIYKAFTDADALAAWLPPHGFVARTHSMDARVGCGYRMSFFTATKSWEQAFHGTYLEMVPFSRLVYTAEFESDDPTMQGVMTTTIRLTPVPEGTLVEVEQAGIPPGPSASGAPYGWSQSFEKLAQLVEPELPF